jgi:sortase B
MKKIIYYALIAVFSCVFLVSVYFIGDYYLESLSSQSSYDSLANLVEQGKTDIPKETILYVPPEVDEGIVPTEVPQGPTDPTSTMEDLNEPSVILPEYSGIYLLNSDLVGWINIPDTQINYPVMQSPDRRDYYLTRDFDGKDNKNGCIYVREQCNVFRPSDNLTIYGHNMRNGNMFHDLHKFRDKSFWDGHRYFTFDTILEHHTYEILAVFTTTASVGRGFAYHLFVNATTEEEFDRYVAKCKELSLYDTGVTAAYGDKLISLSTCEYSQVNGRLVVVAKRVN